MRPIVDQTLKEIWTKAGPVQSTSVSTPESALGFFAFAFGTIVTSIVLSGILPATAMIAVVPALLIFAGLAQFTAGLLALIKGNTFAATMFGAYGANSALVAMFVWMAAIGLIPASDPNDGMVFGIGLLCMSYISLILGLAAVKLNPTYLAIVVLLVPGFALPGLEAMGASPALGHVGGYFLFVSGVLALYAGTAIVVNSTHQRNVVTLGRFRDRGEP